MHDYDLEKQIGLRYFVRQDDKIKCNCGHETKFIKGMIGRAVNCENCESLNIVITDRKTIKAHGIYFNEQMQELYSVYYIVCNFEVEHFEQRQITMNYISDHPMHLSTVINNMGILSYSYREDEHWRNPIPSIKTGTAQYQVSKNINTWPQSFQNWHETNEYWKSRNKYFKAKHLKALDHYSKTRFADINTKYDSHDPFVIEKLINQVPDLLHWYMDDNFNVLTLNKQEVKFIIENNLSLDQAQAVAKLHKLNIKKINKWITSERYDEIFKDSYKELETKSKDFIIKMPRTPEELEQEGKTLNHCVGSYKNKHGKTTTIVFVRKAKNPDKPFITCEFKNGRINQYYTKHNEIPKGKAFEFRSLLEKELKEQLC